MPGFTGPSVNIPPKIGPWPKGRSSAQNTTATAPPSTGGLTPTTSSGGGTPAPAPSFEGPSTGTGAGISVGGSTDASSGGFWDRIKSWLPENPIGEGGGPFFNPTPSWPGRPESSTGTGGGGDSTAISGSGPFMGMFD